VIRLEPHPLRRLQDLFAVGRGEYRLHDERAWHLRHVLSYYRAHHLTGGRVLDLFILRQSEYSQVVVVWWLTLCRFLLQDDGEGSAAITIVALAIKAREQITRRDAAFSTAAFFAGPGLKLADLHTTTIHRVDLNALRDTVFAMFTTNRCFFRLGRHSCTKNTIYQTEAHPHRCCVTKPDPSLQGPLLRYLRLRSKPCKAQKCLVPLFCSQRCCNSCQEINWIVLLHLKLHKGIKRCAHSLEWLCGEEIGVGG
jgi:hypothetical protein